MDAVIETGALCEAAICYTGDLLDPARPKYNLKYYVNLAKQLEKAGAHILGIKDMAGVCKPRAARELVLALKQEVGLPIHFHTHDTSGIAAASVLAAVEAGCDAVDGALDALSGLTSQPNLGAIAAALAGSDRDPGLDLDALRGLSQLLGGGAPLTMPPSRPISAPAPPTSIATRCPAANTPTCASRLAPWGWITAGARSPRPMSTSTTSLATSSRSPPPLR
jgi:isopropylmalate/homocitrate/citramalate synthase